MADTAYLQVTGKYLIDGNDATPLIDFHPDKFVPSDASTGAVIRQTALETQQDLVLPTTSTAVQALVIKNNDVANYVELMFPYTDATFTVHDNVIKIPAGAFIVLPATLDYGGQITTKAYGAPVQIDVMAIV